MTGERPAWEYRMSSRLPDPPQKRHSRELRQLNKFQKYLNSTDFTLPAGQRQSQLQLIQKEAIFFSGYGTKIPIPKSRYRLLGDWLSGYKYGFIPLFAK
jgi:hypothetical protein